MAESTAQEPVKDYIPQEYLEIEPVTAYCNWVLGKPFKDSIAKMDTPSVRAYIHGIKSEAPEGSDARRFWSGYEAGLLKQEKLADDEIFAIGYDAALGIIKPPAPKRKPKNISA